MSKKRILPVYPIATNGDLSANFTSAPTLVHTFDRFNLLINITGTPTGTLEIQASLDYRPPVSGSAPFNANSGTWYTLPFSATDLPPLTGGPEDYMIDFTASGMVALRVNYVFTGGTGLMNASIAAKES